MIAAVLTLTVALLGLMVSTLDRTAAAQADEPTYPVTGTVTGTDGQPVAGMTFYFTGMEPELPDYEVTTDAQGRYALEVVGGRYNGYFFGNTHVTYFLDLGPDSAGVLVDGPTVIDATLVRYAALTGTVRGPDGPVAGARVVTFQLSDGRWSASGGGVSGADGSYRVPRLEPGIHRVRIEATGFLTEFHPDAREVFQADDLALGEGDNVLDPVIGRGTLRIGGRITYRGDPLRGLRIRVSQVTSTEVVEVAEALTAPDGTWSVPVWPGQYQARTAGYTALTPGDYSGGGVTVTTSDVLGLDADLQGGVLQGRVTGAGEPIPAHVGLFLVRSDRSGIRCMFTGDGGSVDASGFYAVDGLAAATPYYVQAVPRGEATDLFVGEAYPDAPPGCDPPALPIEARDGLVIDFDLARVGTSPSPSPTVTPSESPSPTVTPSESPSPNPGPQPVLLGVPKVGGVLAVLSWPRAGATVTRQWLRDGTPIPGATSVLYQVKGADRGTLLSARLTYTRADGSVSLVTTKELRIR
ncbi:carboxypeptidase regulatory-like domain-containing protein [Nocardioides sp. 616]|uniref:carboxypeptidase-like regulatory domain-containing protein n=1 Tax=Nocardioides sp. 616 TaxID=2268090 RepID=UPI0013B41216|nr:carboxypeptidase regulatory-like domain-containing protein [Nocardioides sp. 616]